MIKVIYNKTCGRCVQSEPLTSGMVGQPIHFEYSHDFDGLAVTAVFTDGKNTVNVVNPGNECIIPHEVLTNVGAAVKVGIYAVRGNELVIPTVYATIGFVLKGADPSGDVSIDPTLPVWAQIEASIGNLNDLDTEAKNNLVAAINEAAQSGGGGGGASIAMRVEGGYIQYSTDNGKTWGNLVPEAALQGDKGEKGADGVSGVDGKDGAPGIYYGTTQPTSDTHPVWIDPDGGPDDGGLLPAVTADDNGKVLRVAGGAWSAQEMPSALPNPYALTFTGAVTGSYDGSAPLSVEIPSGGGSSGGSTAEWQTILTGETTVEAVTTVTIPMTASDFDEYRAVIVVGRNTDGITTNNNTNIWIDGYRCAYYMLGINYSQYVGTFSISVEPIPETSFFVNGGYTTWVKKSTVDHWLNVPDSSGSSGPKSILCWNTNPTGTLQIKFGTAYSGTIIHEVMAR